MKKLMIAMAGLLLAAGYAQAGSGCCPLSAKKAEAADAAQTQVAKAEAALEHCSMECLDTIELSAEQKEQIQTVKAECDQMECSVSAKKQMTGELAKILSADQLEQIQAYCEKECGVKS